MEFIFITFILELYTIILNFYLLQETRKYVQKTIVYPLNYNTKLVYIYRKLTNSQILEGKAMITHTKPLSIAGHISVCSYIQCSSLNTTCCRKLYHCNTILCLTRVLIMSDMNFAQSALKQLLLYFTTNPIVS